MRILIVVGTVLLASLVSGNITGQHPATGTCLCLTGTNVRGHSAADLQSSAIASLSKPECHKYAGGMHSADGYTWYSLSHVNGHTVWVAGNYLSVSGASHCTTSAGGATCHDATAKNYACKLLNLADAGTIALWHQHPSGRTDNAYAYNNIRDACHGVAASRSHYSCNGCMAPGGHVCLSGKLLKYIWEIHQHFGYIHVNEIAGACHSCHSHHYEGVAVDLHNPSGQSAYMLSKCFSDGGWGQNEGNHVHCQFV